VRAGLCLLNTDILKSKPPATQNVIRFGERAFKKVMKLKWCHYGRLIIISVLIDHFDKWRHQGYVNTKNWCEDPVRRPWCTRQGEKLSEEITLWIHTLILDFQPPKLWANKFLLLYSPVCGILFCLSWQINAISFPLFKKDLNIYYQRVFFPINQIFKMFIEKKLEKRIKLHTWNLKKCMAQDNN
jgi:hypothetical protein